MNQLEIWSVKMLASSLTNFRACGDKLTHLKPRDHHQLLLLVLGWVRVVQVAMEPSSQLISRLLWKVSTSLSLWSALAAVAVLHRDTHVLRVYLMLGVSVLLRVI